MTVRPDLMGTAEVAALLGISRQRVLQLAAEPGFPPPLAALSMGNVWDGTRIREWAADYTPRTRKRQATRPVDDRS